MSYEFEKSKLYAYLGETITDLFTRHKVIVAGGTITSLFCHRDINDVDVYVRDEQSMADLITELWDIATPMAHTKKATLFTHSDVHIQVVHFAYFPDAQSIFDTFDYTVCMGAFDFATEEFTLHGDFLHHNASRILKFNKSTAYPIVSLLRVQKYREKGYTISKPEYLRVALACMNLDITSYAELKEHLGGMYGINYDKLFAFDDDTPFSLDTAIDNIADLNLHEDYFKMPDDGIPFNDVEEVIDNIIDKAPRYVEINDEWYRITRRGTLRNVTKNDVVLLNCVSAYATYSKPSKPDVPSNAEILDGREYVSNLKFYKFVEKRDGGYYSFYDKNFRYEIGDVVSANTPHGRLYFVELPNVNHASYQERSGRALIEVAIDYDDFIVSSGSQVTATSCRVLREVPKEEYEQYL